MKRCLNNKANYENSNLSRFFSSKNSTNQNKNSLKNYFTFCFRILYVRHYSVALDTFAEVIKVTNHPGLWDAEIAWYSLSDTRLICVYGFKHDLEIYSFRPTWTCLVVKVLATGGKSFEPSSSWMGINCTVKFRTMNIFSCFHCAMAQFELISHKFPNQNTLQIYLRSFHIPHGMKQCTTCQCTNYHNTIDYRGYVTYFELLRFGDIVTHSCTCENIAKALAQFRIWNNSDCEICLSR